MSPGHFRDFSGLGWDSPRLDWDTAKTRLGPPLGHRLDPDGTQLGPYRDLIRTQWGYCPYFAETWFGIARTRSEHNWDSLGPIQATIGICQDLGGISPRPS
jgi:hypothetical protein